jgi:hypothetical protein
MQLKGRQHRKTATAALAGEPNMTLSRAALSLALPTPGDNSAPDIVLAQSRNLNGSRFVPH